MTKVRYEDCSCEDYPCCGHYDILHGDEGMAEYCDCCGYNHSPFLDCNEDDEDYDEDEVDTDDDGNVVDLDWGGEDRHLESAYEDRFAMEDY